MIFGNSVSQVPINYSRRMHSLSHARLQVLGGDEKWIIKIHVNLHCVCGYRARYHFWVPRLSSIKRLDGPLQSLCGTTHDKWTNAMCEFIYYHWMVLLIVAIASSAEHFKLQCRTFTQFIAAAFFSPNSHIHITQHIEHSISVETSGNHLSDFSFKFRVNDAVKGLCTDARRAANSANSHGKFPPF